MGPEVTLAERGRAAAVRVVTPLGVIWRWARKLDRVWQLVFVVVVTLAVLAGINGLTGAGLYQALLFPPLNETAAVQAWSARVYAAVFVLGLPVALLLWHWRDTNVRHQIENARRDTSLKEFQEVQMRAAGAIDDKYPKEARQALQIAALHQLRAFLRGDFGEVFKRPAFELLLAGHAAAMETIGTHAIRDWLATKPVPSAIGREVWSAVSALRAKLDPVMHERIGIIRDEADAIFRAGFPLNRRCFDLIELPPGYRFAEKTDMSFASFVGAYLFGAHLEGAVLDGAHLEGANLYQAHLEGAVLDGAHIEGANLYQAHLEGAHLHQAHLEGVSLHGAYLGHASLMDARLEGADLGWAHLEGASLRQAHLQGANLDYAQLPKAILFQAHLAGASLQWAQLADADLYLADLEGAFLGGANLEGAKLRQANLQRADLSSANLARAVFDDGTAFAEGWAVMDEAERNKIRDSFRARGMRHHHYPNPDSPADQN